MTGRTSVLQSFFLFLFFCPPRQETAFTKASGHPVERVVYMVGQKPGWIVTLEASVLTPLSKVPWLVKQ